MAYLRHPTISGDTIAFSCEDDIWTVGVEGGRARRLTAGRAEASRPQLSRDGDRLAFTSNDEAVPEVWVMPTRGGQPQRLTHFGALITATIGWDRDDRILAVSTAEQPFKRWTQPWAIDPGTGRAERLPIGPVRALSYDVDGRGAVLTRDSVDPARWKRYRGGTAGKIWVDRRGDGTWRRILADNPADLAFAMWVNVPPGAAAGAPQSRIYFLSDHEGVGNLYSVRPGGQDLRRHTDHEEFYARFAASDGRRIVYAHAADIWLYDPADDTTVRVDITAGGGSGQRRRRFVKPLDALTGFTLHPHGQSALLETRGQIVDLPLWEDAARPIAPEDGVRQRLASYLPDGETIVAVTDVSGEERLVVHPADGPSRQLPADDLGDIWELVAAPAGPPRVAVTNNRHEVYVVDTADGQARLLDRSVPGDLTGLDWSPDGRWLAYSVARTRTTRSIAACDVDSGRVVEITRPEFRDHAPAWDPSGRFLYFLSHRMLDPVPDEVFFDLNFPRSVKVLVVPLRAGDRSPFVAAARPMRPAEPGEPSRRAATGAAGAGTQAQPPEVRVDRDGIERRAVTIPVDTGRYHRITPLADSLLLLAREIEGTRHRDVYLPPVASDTVLKVEVPSGRCEPLLAEVAKYSVSADHSTILYRSGDRLRALPAGEKPPSPEQSGGDGPSRASGWLDLERVRIPVDPAAEWRQMYDETWRWQRDLFWDASISGIDWERVRDRYRPVLAKVGSRSELSDLLWELQGELGTSHAYEMGGDRRRPEPWTLGLLGADLGLDSRGRWRIERIVRADHWDPEAGSPLEAPGVDVSDGDLILEVDRRPVGADRPVGAELVNRAGVAVELTVSDGRGRRRRHVVVTPLGDEGPLRYRAWVEDRRRYVHDATDGRAGYVHIPDMGVIGYAEFHRSFLSEVEHDGLVVDVRDNGGGFVSQLILEKLSRRRVGWDVLRHGADMPYPQDSPAGPLVAVTNENAGSDGDIFSHCFKLMGLGPLVGMRTWGGVIGINGKHRLVDGTVVTQPEFSFWFNDVGWSVENYGTDPDVVVDKSPSDWAAGADPQLDRAIALLRRALRGWKPPRPTTPRPNLALPEGLPPRPQQSSSR